MNEQEGNSVAFLIGFVFWIVCGIISFIYVLIRKKYDDDLFEVFVGCFMHGPIGTIFMLAEIAEDIDKKKKEKKISDKEFERIKREYWEKRLEKGK